MTLMVVNEEHYINRVFSEPGTYELTVEEHGSPFVTLAGRTFVDPSDPDDVAAVNALQDALTVETNSATPYTHPDYEEEPQRHPRRSTPPWPGGTQHRPHVRQEVRCRCNQTPNRYRSGLGRATRVRGVLLHRIRTPGCWEIYLHIQGRTRRCLLVGDHLQP